MAKWTVAPETSGNTMKSTIQYDDTGADADWVIEQDVSDILKEVELDRQLLESGGKKEMGWRKAFTIPDIVAIDILQNHGLDVHDPLFMKDQDKLNRLKYIVRTEYPYLLIST